ncbi:MAG: hypothetical protein LCH95_22340 [Proteobacteria bacterium]|nr:hypothetical protein [Pseudomonadota bacterium]
MMSLLKSMIPGLLGIAATIAAIPTASAERRPDLEVRLGGAFENYLLGAAAEPLVEAGWMADYDAAPPDPASGPRNAARIRVRAFGPPWDGYPSVDAFYATLLSQHRQKAHLASTRIAGVDCERGPQRGSASYIVTLCKHDGFVVLATTHDLDRQIDDIALVATLLGRLGATREDDAAARCPPPGADTLAKRAAIDTEWVVDFLRTRLAIRSELERRCFNAALRLEPGAVESITPAFYDALAARQDYDAALAARRRWFSAQRGQETEAARRAEANAGTDSWPVMLLGEAAARTSALPPGIVATAVLLFEAEMQHLRDTVVIPAFNEDLYASYRRLRLQHDSVEAFDIASTRPGSAYHLLVQQMVPRAGAQALSGEARSQRVAAFWRAWLETRFQADETLSKGPPDQQVKDALAPAQRCIGRLRASFARCVTDVEKALGR